MSFVGYAVANTPTNPDFNNMSKYGAFGALSDFPSGYGFDGFQGAAKAGNMGSTKFLEVTANAQGTMGVNLEGTSSISFSCGDAIGELIVSGSGNVGIAISAEGGVVASLNGAGSTTFTVSMNHLAMFVDAYGFASAQLDLITSGSGTLRAIAICSGSTVDVSGLTPASIWAYGDRTLTALDVEVSGLTQDQSDKLDSIAGLTGLIPALL